MFPRAERLRSWLNTQSGRRVLVDLVLIAGFAAAVRLITLDMDLFERLHDYTRQHEAAEVDEWIVTIVIAGLAFVVFGIRRVQDQRRELALRLAAEQHATMLAMQDQLTGLPNRRRFNEAISAINPDGSCHALILMDLDGFKLINDAFGHPAGDEALRTVAWRLRSICAARMLPARLGGDEFAILAHDIDGIDQAVEIAKATIAEIDAPIVTAGVEQHLNVSLGVTLIEDESDPAEEFLRRADTALYHAKRTRGSSYVVYESRMNEALTEQVKLERELREALASGEIVPNYQPIVDLKTGNILMFEALARWRHPTRGNIAPSIFIPLAEERGLIAELTETMLAQACYDAASWPSSIRLSVNLSPVLIKSSSFGLKLVKILSASNLPASRLAVEITEQALEADISQVRDFLENLRSLGIHIALDDFGTGYSSLSRLRALPFDELKIDGSFVQGLGESNDQTLFVRTILELGRGLGLTVTAEGVEDAEQRRLLLAEGCAQGQGFLFSEAVPVERVHLLLAKQTRTARPRLAG